MKRHETPLNAIKHFELIQKIFFSFFFFAPFFLLGQNEFGTNSQIIESKWGKSGDSTSANNFIGTVNNSPLIFKTNNEERLRISENGKIGVGIANPIRTFEVNGDVGINGSLYLTNLDSSGLFGQQNSGTFLMVNNNKVIKTSIETLRNIVYSPPSPEPPLTACDLAGYPIQQNPAWYNAPFKL